MTYYEERRPRVAAVTYSRENHSEVMALLLENGFTEVSVRYTDADTWVEAKGDGRALTFTHGDVLVQPVVYKSTHHGWVSTGHLLQMTEREFRNSYERANDAPRVAIQ